MGIAHGHGDGGVAEDFLQHQDVAAVHHKVAGEAVPQYVGILPGWQLQPCSLDHHFEGAIAVTKQAAALSRQLSIEIRADGHATALLALGAGKGHSIRGYLGVGQLFYLRPAGTSNEAELHHHQQIGVCALGAGGQQTLEFVRVEKSELGLGHLVGTQTIERVLPLPLP